MKILIKHTRAHINTGNLVLGKVLRIIEKKAPKRKRDESKSEYISRLASKIKDHNIKEEAVVGWGIYDDMEKFILKLKYLVQ